jgi:hypothetical protein
MARERIVDYIGASDEELARLRLMMRKAGKQLVEKWRLRLEPDEKADLILVDPTTVVGSTALARAREGAMPCIVVADEGATAGAQEILQRPFKVEDVVKMLNAAGRAAMTASLPQPKAIEAKITHNVFDDIFTPAEDTVTAVELDLDFANLDFDIPTATTFNTGFEESEALFKHNADREHRAALKGIKLDDEIEIEATDGHTERTGAKKERAPGTIYVSSKPPDLARVVVDEPASDDERFQLAAYMTRSLLGGPSRLVHGNLAPLTLDPRGKLFYAKGSLCVFEQHCMRQFPRSSWHALSAAEFAEVREQYSGRDYVELLWLATYLNSGGRLANHMDPSALYRLRKPLNLGRDYPQASKIIGLMQRPSRAADLAVNTRCEVGEVYNVLNAFDVIGYLDRA